MRIDINNIKSLFISIYLGAFRQYEIASHQNARLAMKSFFPFHEFDRVDIAGGEQGEFVLAAFTGVDFVERILRGFDLCHEIYFLVDERQQVQPFDKEKCLFLFECDQIRFAEEPADLAAHVAKLHPGEVGLRVVVLSLNAFLGFYFHFEMLVIFFDQIIPMLVDVLFPGRGGNLPAMFDGYQDKKTLGFFAQLKRVFFIETVFGI